ncbi:hypothetical protein CDL15_Pgr026357 [Punica granatum]|nr:hypothetical protein CDL15_Pgr026357 [Punica granatum]
MVMVQWNREGERAGTQKRKRWNVSCCYQGGQERKGPKAEDGEEVKERKGCRERRKEEDEEGETEEETVTVMAGEKKEDDAGGDGLFFGDGAEQGEGRQRIEGLEGDGELEMAGA